MRSKAELTSDISLQSPGEEEGTGMGLENPEKKIKDKDLKLNVIPKAL